MIVFEQLGGVLEVTFMVGLKLGWYILLIKY